jgi:hypothetical protein
MKYLLILMIWAPHHEVSITQLGPFRDLFACEAAAAQATIFQLTHAEVTVQSFCAAERVYLLPKGKK